MLFVVTHTHTPELCPVDNPVAVQQMANEQHIEKSGVKVLGSYISAPEHILYFILEAQEYAPVVKYLRPLMKIGTPRISPVQTVAEAMGIFPTKK